jgi:hypothetical protein
VEVAAAAEAGMISFAFADAPQRPAETAATAAEAR